MLKNQSTRFEVGRKNARQKTLQAAVAAGRRRGSESIHFQEIDMCAWACCASVATHAGCVCHRSEKLDVEDWSFLYI